MCLKFIDYLIFIIIIFFFHIQMVPRQPKISQLYTIHFRKGDTVIFNKINYVMNQFIIKVVTLNPFTYDQNLLTIFYYFSAFK